MFSAGADTFDFTGYRSLCDVGGASGTLCIEVARKHRHLHCTSFDLPPVEPVAKKAIAAAGLESRITTASGDFFEQALPNADVITMGMILHDWNLQKKMYLIRSAYEALPPGGALVAIEALIDDAFDFTGADFAGWCREAGFTRHEVIPLAGASSAAIAYK